MAVTKKFKALGVDVHDQVSVVRIINGLSITDVQKTAMLRQYLNEMKLTLSTEAWHEATFPE